MNLPCQLQRLALSGVITAILFSGVILVALYTTHETHNNSHSQSGFQDSGSTPHAGSSLATAQAQAIGTDHSPTANVSIATEQKSEIDRLEGLHDELTIKRLARILVEGSDPAVRQHAVAALARIGSAHALAVIAQGLEDNDELVREVALRALLSAQYEESDFILGQIVHGDRSIHMRIVAVELLSKRDNKMAESFLTAATRDSHPKVSKMATQALAARH